ncbi:alpha/beta hydrolase [Actinocatenispora sera]|uniref:Non-heme chloroperoxidase n=1 Tax=Actinocatenispora sera TaxID=390989 RepID=A0A810KYW7_9ACTN|nr:alpha/beta hydrolase [Actinocatenispora sera]BCJ28383.1 non-heme chloroperoxidase [Actinocatenispora sera]
MGYVTVADGTEIYYKDWGSGQPVVFSHGWPLNADAWEDQMLCVAENGYRGIAHDRRGHGRSSKVWHGYDYDTFADDLAALIEKLDLHDVVLVAHSMGGGEIARYVGRHGTARIAKMVTVGAVPPLMLKTDGNPDGTPMEVFDGIRDGLRNGRAQFWRDLSEPFFGANRPGNKVTQGNRDDFWRMAMQQTIKGAIDCVAQFSETDFTPDLRRIDVPTLLVHGDDDQIVPIVPASQQAATIIPNATLKVYPGAAHGLASVAGTREQFNTDLLDFLKS